MAPQIIYIILASMFMAVGIMKHGDNVKRHCGWEFLLRMLTIGLLYWGGFFDCFGK